ncbi:MAG TPA: CHASE2 domain-containing protein [Solirubrobacteraceae bacterium]|nr:CHASE2 domain-containing protein [Solirubrobacteraceae bacterium]
MPHRSRPTPKTVAAILAALVAVAAGVVPFVLNAWPQLENNTLNTRFGVRGAVHAPSDVVVVAIDDRTFSDLGLQWPFPRNLHAEVIDRLRADGARAIAYDIQFTEPSNSARNDLKLYDAVARARNVVLATTVVDAAGKANVFGGAANVRAAHAVVGTANLPADAGGVIRRYARTMLGLPSFAVAAARMAGHPIPRGRFHDGTALIDFQGPPGTIRTVSFSDVLRGRVSPSVFAGKIVVVGATSATLQDVHATSTTAAAPMAGAEVQANAIWTALHDNPLQPSDEWLTLVAIMLCALAAPLAGLRFRVLVSTLVGFAVGGLYLVVSQLAFDSGTAMVVSYPVVAGAVGIVAMLVARYGAAVAERNAFLRRLQASQLELIQRLAQAIDSRDAETGEHTYRIAVLCRRLALELGWKPAAAESLMHASVAHDVGKIGISDSVLLKAGPLDSDEWETMKAHTEIGARLLTGSDNPLLQMAETIARTHHEWWDGHGYPRGLRGEEIPIEGRMCAVVDVYDALLSKRSYKDAWRVDDVLAELERGSGTQFDPAVVSAFLRLAPKLDAELHASFVREKASARLEPMPA